jgi:hypothetical protein
VSKNSGQNRATGVFSQSVGKFGLGQYLSYRLLEIFGMSDKSKIEWTDAPQCGVRKSETGRELDRRTYDEFPERRQTPVPDLEFGRNALERLETELV